MSGADFNIGMLTLFRDQLHELRFWNVLTENEKDKILDVIRQAVKRSSEKEGKQ